MAASPAYCRALVQRLRSGSPSSEADAAARLETLVRGGGDAAAAAAAAGAVAALVQFLRHSSPFPGQMEAAVALAGLCLYQPTNARQLVHAGAVPVLVRLLSGATKEVAMVAADTLANIAAFLPEMRQELGTAAFPSLLSLLRSGSTNAQEHALSAINNLWVQK